MSAPSLPARVYSPSEDRWSALTHGLGVVLSLIGMALLMRRAIPTGDPWRIGSSAIFATSAFLLYSASTLYHGRPLSPARMAYKRLDHSLIYVLIAGTYTPFLLICLRDGWGWTLFAVIWSLALAGVIFKMYFTGRFRGVSTILYLGMGWLCVGAARPMLDNVPADSLVWLLAGGLCYTGGTLFYMRKSMNQHHAIWHLFVLAGTACHFHAIHGFLLFLPETS